MHLRLLLGVCWVWLPGPNRTAGVIVAAEPVAGKDKLSAIEVDIGDEEPVKIVTNAPNAKEGNRIVVATIGATVSPRPPPPPTPAPPTPALLAPRAPIRCMLSHCCVELCWLLRVPV